MAERIGRAVLELSTDATSFNAGLQDANQRITNLAKNFRETGTKLDSVAAGMSLAGKEASASSKMIAGMSQVGREEMARLSAETSKVPTQFNLANSAAGLLKSTFGQFTAATVVANGVMAIVASVREFVQVGAKLPAVESSFERLTNNVRQDSGQMLTALRTATMGMVSNYDLMVSANNAMLLKLPATAESMGEMATAAVTLGRAVGKDATSSLREFIEAIGKGSPDILNNFGIIVKAEEAYTSYAATLHKSVDQLTAQERQMAIYTSAMDKAREMTAALGQQTKTLGEIGSTAWTSFGNGVSGAAATINVGLGQAASSGRAFIDFLGDLLKMGPGAAVMMARNREEFDRAAKAAHDIVLEVEKAPAVMKTYAEQLAIVRGEAAGLTAAQRQEILAAKQLGVDVDDLTKKFGISAGAVAMVTEQHKAGAKSATENAAAIKKAAEDAWKATRERLDREGAAIMAAYDERNKLRAKEEAEIKAEAERHFSWLLKNLDREGVAVMKALEERHNAIASQLKEDQDSAIAAGHVFQGVATNVSGIFNNLFSGFTGGLDSIWKGMSGEKGFPGLMKNLGGSIVDGFGSILSGGLTSMINMGVQLAFEGAKKIAKIVSDAFKSEESLKVNSPRDEFIAQFGPGGTGAGSGFMNLASLLTQFGAGDGGGDLFRALAEADTESRFKSAQVAISEFLGRHDWQSALSALQSQASNAVKQFGGGGFVSAPTLGMVGEAGPEVIYPLDRFERLLGIDRHGGGQPLLVRLEVDGVTLAERMVRHMPRALSHAGLA